MYQLPCVLTLCSLCFGHVLTAMRHPSTVPVPNHNFGEDVHHDHDPGLPGHHHGPGQQGMCPRFSRSYIAHSVALCYVPGVANCVFRPFCGLPRLPADAPVAACDARAQSACFDIRMMSRSSSSCSALPPRTPGLRTGAKNTLTSLSAASSLLPSCATFSRR